MARKRMISPEMWASSSFAELSDFAKIVFIGLISNADDEGKGEADPALLKSTLFPRDEKKRAADVKSALSEIARSTSTLFYSVEGKNYYILTKWKTWQKLDRPTPSKIPNPPETMGGKGNYTQNLQFDESSTSTRRTLDESSLLIERNMNKKENRNRSSRSNLLTDEEYRELCDTIGQSDCDYYIERVKAFKESKPTATFNVKATILKWYREDKAKEQAGETTKAEIAATVNKTYTAEQLNAYFDNLSYEDL